MKGQDCSNMHQRHLMQDEKDQKIYKRMWLIEQIPEMIIESGKRKRTFLQ